MPVIDFRNGIPEFMVSDGGKTEIVYEQYKQGDRSLKWAYNENDSLRFNVDIGYRNITDADVNADRYAFFLYLFGVSGGGKLQIEFLKGEKVQQSFAIQLGFKGWRSVTVSFDRDMEGVPDIGMDALRITAHGTGELLLDEIVTAVRMDVRLIAASWQVPFIKVEETPAIKERVIKEEFIGIDAPNTVIDSVCDKYKSFLLAEFDTDLSPDELIKTAEFLEIKTGKYGLYGKRIENPVFRSYVERDDGVDEEYIQLSKVSDLLSDIAIVYHKTRDERLPGLYINILRYIILQGYEEGGRFGMHALLDYFLKTMYQSVVLMRDIIIQSDLRGALFRAMRYFTHIDRCGYLAGTHTGYATADDMNNLLVGMFATSMIAPESEQAMYLMAVSRWVDFNLHCTDGLKGMIKEDGCIYHHRNHYIAYGAGALRGIAPFLYSVSNTDFDIGETARYNIKKVLLELRFQCCGRDYPIAFSARHPLGSFQLYLIMYKYYALYEMDKGDKKMAQVYLRLKDTPDDEMDIKLRRFAGCAEDAPEGNRVYSMACASVHRRDNWVAIVKGHSKYLWGNETYKENNLYGRYRSYGNIELLTKGNLKESGFSHEGYDWNRFPGTTSIYTPFDELKARVYHLDAYSGWEEMLLSDQSFAGGCNLGDNGMFSMILKEHPKYNGTFTAHKSVFMHDDFILAVGSNISNVSKYETETTLFQNAITDGDTPVCKRGNEITDNKGNVFYVEGDCEIYTYEGEQITPGSTGSTVGKGNFAVGVIKHGISPDNASYVYGIGVNGAPKRDYKVLRCDDVAHVVMIEDTTYMAIFKPSEFDMIKTSAPIMLIRKDGHDSVKVSVCDPDLMLYDTDASQYDRHGNRKEVSVYSRQWLENSVGGRYVSIEMDVGKYNLYLNGGKPSEIEIKK